MVTKEKQQTYYTYRHEMDWDYGKRYLLIDNSLANKIYSGLKKT